MTNKYERVKKLIAVLKDNICRKQVVVADILYAHADYKTNNILPDKSMLVPFDNGGIFPIVFDFCHCITPFSM